MFCSAGTDRVMEDAKWWRISSGRLWPPLVYALFLTSALVAVFDVRYLTAAVAAGSKEAGRN